MMDELELLKKDWQKKEVEHPKLSYNEIYGMLWKKSSSIVKWIFLISIIEFALPHIFYLFPSTWSDGMALYSNLGLRTPLFILSAIQYSVVFYFIFQFYKRYKEISVLDNAKNLMSKIIRTRRTVKHYIVFSLSSILIIFTTVVICIYLNDDFVHSLELSGKDLSKVSKDKLDNLKILSMAILAIAGVILTVMVGVIYFLIYGILLKKLNKNYKEIRKLEI